MSIPIDIIIISYNGLLVPKAISSLQSHHNTGAAPNIITQVAKQSIPLNVNAGFKKVTSDWFVLWNDDWEAMEDGWLDRMLLFGLSDPAIGFVSCRVVFDTGKLNHGGYFISEHGMVGNLHKGEPDHALPDAFIRYAHPILINSDVFRKLGGYDEKFLGSQYADIDFVYRTVQSGFKIFFAGSVPILHHYGENKVTNGVRERVKKLNEARFRAKHGFAGRKGGFTPKKFPRRR